MPKVRNPGCTKVDGGQRWTSGLNPSRGPGGGLRRRGVSIDQERSGATRQVAWVRLPIRCGNQTGAEADLVRLSSATASPAVSLHVREDHCPSMGYPPG